MALKKLDEAGYSVPTKLIYGKSFTGQWDYSHHVIPPMTASSTFRLDSAARGAEGFGAIGQSSMLGATSNPIYVYDRMGEPNNDLLQDGLATAEGAEVGVTFATGMAAVHAATSFLLQKDDEIISHKMIYGCTYSLFTAWMPRFGVKVHFCDCKDPDSFLAHVNERTRVLYLESPANPTLDLIDLDAIAARLKEINKKRPADRQIVSIIDNTFATPFCQRPLEHGIDIVLHSLTKGISGFGTEMGGAVLTRREFLDPLILFRKDFGGTLSPHTAWHILVYGLATMALRVPRQQASAHKIAQFLSTHPRIEQVRYPGLESFAQYDIAQRMLRDYEGNFAPGFMLYFTLKGKNPEESKLNGQKLMDYIAQNAYTITLAVSLGQLRTLIEHPGSMTHAAYPAEDQMKLGIDPGGIRLAVGIENADDIIRDLDTALSKAF